MLDPRVTKLMLAAAGRLGGLSTMTNDLDAAPLISRDYFRHRRPERYERRTVWCVGFVATHPDHRGGARSSR